jgi:general secretion pathway protein H
MRNKGFSLIELMVVLILIGLSVSLVVPSLSRFSKTIELKTAAKKISEILRYCRSEAVNKGLVYQVFFDSDLREVRVQSMEENREDEQSGGKGYQKTYSLPVGIQIGEMDIPSPQYSSGLPAIEFYPNGGSNGGSFLVNTQDRKGYKIKVHFLTGIVKVEKAEGFRT